MAIDFNDRLMVTNPTCYLLGLGLGLVGGLAIGAGVITYYTGDVFLPARAWPAVGVPTLAIGGIFVRSGLTKS